MDMDAILRRIQKLLAIAQDARGDANEAAAAAAQAENIMRKFNVDHAALLAAELRRDAKAHMGTTRCRANMKRDDASRTQLKRAPRWAGWLAFELAMLNDAQAAFVRDSAMGGIVVEFRGVATDVQVAAWMFESLVGQMILGVRTWTKAHRAAHGAPPSKPANNAFRIGFVQSLLRSLRALRAEKDAEMQQASDSRALVVSKAAAVAEHFGAAKYKAGGTTEVNDARAYAAGRAAGERVDVRSRGVTGSSTHGAPALRLAA